MLFTSEKKPINIYVDKQKNLLYLSAHFSNKQKHFMIKTIQFGNILLPLLSLILASGCKKENPSNIPTNPSGNCKVKTENTSGSGIQPFRNEYEYDNSGQLIKMHAFQNNAENSYDTYEYESNGNTKTWSQFDPSGAIHYKRISSFDGQGRVSGYMSITWEPFNVDTSYYKFAYADNRMAGYELNGTDTSRKIIRYYQNDNLTRLEAYLGTGGTLLEVHTYTYSTVLNKRYDEEKKHIVLSRALPNKYLPSRHTITDASTNQVSYDETYTYTTNSEGYVLEMKTQNVLFPSMSPWITTYSYKCD